MQPKDRILVALDVSKLEDLVKYAKSLGPHVGGFKIGLEALLAIGLGPALNAIRGYGPATDNVFVDAKLHDIPNTMAGAVRAVVEHPQVKFVNVHASAGEAGMRAAVEAAANVAMFKEAVRARVLAVTVLTSMGDDDVRSVYGGGNVSFPSAFTSDTVHKFASMAVRAGCDGIVCSPQDVRHFRLQAWGKEFAFVTPGVRPKWSAKNDQERVTTPAEAVKNGATYLVIGRPITNPPADIGPPATAARMIAQEIAEALR